MGNILDSTLLRWKLLEDKSNMKYEEAGEMKRHTFELNAQTSVMHHVELCVFITWWYSFQMSPRMWQNPLQRKYIAYYCVSRSHSAPVLPLFVTVMYEWTGEIKFFPSSVSMKIYGCNRPICPHCVSNKQRVKMTFRTRETYILIFIL